MSKSGLNNFVPSHIIFHIVIYRLQFKVLKTEVLPASLIIPHPSNYIIFHQ